MASPMPVSPGGPAVPGPGWQELASALGHEADLLDELRESLLQQRSGVASNDVEVIEGSIQIMGRTLLALGEARELRERLIGHIAGEPVASLTDLEESLSRPLPDAVIDARSTIRRLSAAVAREVAINHHIVRRAMDAGETFIQLLFSSVADPTPAYMPSQKRSGDPPQTGGVLLNKRI